MEFKKEFIEKYKRLTDFEKFKEYCEKFLRRSIRVNTIKTTAKEIKKRFNDYGFTLKNTFWCKDGFFVEGRRDLGNLVEHKLGYFYIQEAASMIPAVVLNPESKDLVLDMCASPGSKTTQISALMKNKGLIIANDNQYKRMLPLTVNLQRCGCVNTIITLMDARRINGSFDKILLDAPCSASGTIRGKTSSSLKTIKMWNINLIKRLAGLQKQLILKAYDLLKDNGTLVYSTCTLEPEEDEDVVEFLLKNREAKVDKINLDIKSSLNNPRIKNCLKIWPHDYDTQGFFVAKIKKL